VEAVPKFELRFMGTNEMGNKQLSYNAAHFFRKNNFLCSCAFPMSPNYDTDGSVTGYDIYMKNMRLINEK